jgi:hypothetical protein
MVGGGAKVTGNTTTNATAVVAQSYPSAASVWTAQAVVMLRAQNGSAPTLTAYVICAQ